MTICDPHNCPFNTSSSNSLDNPLGKLIEALLGLGAFLGDGDPSIIQFSALGGEQPRFQSLPIVVELWVVLVLIQPTCSHQTDILCMLFSYNGRRCSTRATNEFFTISVPDTIDNVGTLIIINYINYS